MRDLVHEERRTLIFHLFITTMKKPLIAENVVSGILERSMALVYLIFSIHISISNLCGVGLSRYQEFCVFFPFSTTTSPDRGFGIHVFCFYFLSTIPPGYVLWWHCILAKRPIGEQPRNEKRGRKRVRSQGRP